MVILMSAQALYLGGVGKAFPHVLGSTQINTCQQEGILNG